MVLFPGMNISTKIKAWAHRIKLDAFAVYYAAKDSRTPRYLRFIALLIVAYAISPIDLIPDFIPILGFLDDLLIVPMGLLVVIKLLPAEVLAESRKRAITLLDEQTSNKFAAVVVATWLLCLTLLLTGWFA